MHKTAQDILSLFRKSGGEIPTSEILEGISESYVSLKEGFRENRNDKEEIVKMHRRVLHHLNKLVDSGILKVVRHGEKGEKVFSLNLEEGEEILEMSPNYKRRVIVSKPMTLSIPIEGHEQKGILIKYEPATWIDRLNSVIVFAEKSENLESLRLLICEHVFPVVNDVISVDNIEEHLKEDIFRFLEKLDSDCEDYGKKVVIPLDLSIISEMKKLDFMISIIGRGLYRNIRFIYSIDNGDIEENYESVKKIVEIYLDQRREIFIKNKKRHDAPYFVGRGGPFCFLEKEWQLAEDLRKGVVCLACSQSSVIVDVDKFAKENGLNIEKFSELMFNISKSMLSANSIQRRKSGDIFRSINKINHTHAVDFLNLSRNYIRFWNYGLHQEGIEPDFILTMINEAKKKINEFAAAEETIYKSCGMTTRFKIALSPSFPTAADLSSRMYDQLKVSKLDDLYNKDFKKKIIERESASQIFDGGNEITFHYEGGLDSEDIMKQISTIMSTYKVPLFTYSFSKVKGDTKLSRYFG